MTRKVLIAAYACEPDAGSEPAVGWHWARQAALRGYDVHVITRSNNRASIETALEQSPQPRLTFHYFDLPRLFLWLKARSGAPGLSLYYYLWQLGMASRARSLHRRLHFDLIHNVTFANDWLPSGLSLVTGPPFVWGPIGGSTHRAPDHIERTWPNSNRRYEVLRRSMQKMFRIVDPLLWWTGRRADVVLPYTEEARDGLRETVRRKSQTVVHIGVESTNPPARQSSNGILTIATGGRLVHWKGHDLVIEGLARHLQQRPESARLQVTGTGPWRSRLEQLANVLGIGESVEFLGFMENRRDLLSIVADADLYALPTWRDGPPVAILEAMSVGTPILCLDLGATAELVTSHTGLLINAGTREMVVDAISKAIGWACNHRRELKEMGNAAAKRAETRHAWSVIGAQIDAIYQELLTQGKSESSRS